MSHEVRSYQVTTRRREPAAASRILTGAVIGAGLALLFAPKKGAELRGELSGSVAAARDNASRRYRAIAETAGRRIGSLERHIDRVAGRGDRAADETWQLDAPPLPPPHAVSEHS